MGEERDQTKRQNKEKREDGKGGATFTHGYIWTLLRHMIFGLGGVW